MKREIITLGVFIFGAFFASTAQSGCPGCIVSLPDDLPADTIFLGSAADGRVGVPYDSDLSFRLPLTTTPVNATDPGTPPGLTIDQITINSVSNLPPGLIWEASQTEFDPAEISDGCVKFCGTPLQPGLYLVEVVVTAQIFVISEVTSFSFPILIEPAVSTTDGFSMVNSSGCGEVTVSFLNNVPSGGAAGFSYQWDFGNGLISLSENPLDQVYTEPGTYPVNYTARVDTLGYFLTGVRVVEVGCTDLLNGPDLKVEVIDPSGELVFISDVINNADPPLDFSLNLSLDTGNYVLRVIDEDNGIGGADDNCGTVNFTRDNQGLLLDTEMTIDLSIFHPVDTITSADTVRVFPQPAAPVISGVPVETTCAGNNLLLSTNYGESIQWYQDSLPVLPGTDPELTVAESGTFWVTYTSVEGCQATSEPAEITFEPLPPPPAFSNQNNELTLFDPDGLPAFYELRWYQEGALLTGEDGFTFCIPEAGNYTLEVVDLQTNCSNSFSQLVQYDPDFPNCISSTDDPEEGDSPWRLYPNPTAAELRIDGFPLGVGEVRWLLRDSRGAQVATNRARPFGNGLTLDLSGFPAGFYWLEIYVQGERKVWKVVKK